MLVQSHAGEVSLLRPCAGLADARQKVCAREAALSHLAGARQLVGRRCDQLGAPAPSARKQNRIGPTKPGQSVTLDKT
jgi:hypothetical protein